MSTIDSIKLLIDGLHNLVHSNHCDIEMYCTDSSGDKSVGLSKLSITGHDERMCLASVVVLDAIKCLISEGHNGFKFDSIHNDSDRLVTVHGVRVIVKMPGCKDIIRNWMYSDPRKLLPNDKFDICVYSTAVPEA